MSFSKFKNEKEFINECAETAQQFAKHGPVECIFYVDNKPVQTITYELETDVETLRAEVAKLKAEKEALENEKHIHTRWACHRGND